MGVVFKIEQIHVGESKSILILIWILVLLRLIASYKKENNIVEVFYLLEVTLCISEKLMLLMTMFLSLSILCFYILILYYVLYMYVLWKFYSFCLSTHKILIIEHKIEGNLTFIFGTRLNSSSWQTHPWIYYCFNRKITPRHGCRTSIYENKVTKVRLRLFRPKRFLWMFGIWRIWTQQD